MRSFSKLVVLATALTGIFPLGASAQTPAPTPAPNLAQEVTYRMAKQLMTGDRSDFAHGDQLEVFVTRSQSPSYLDQHPVFVRDCNDPALAMFSPNQVSKIFGLKTIVDTDCNRLVMDKTGWMGGLKIPIPSQYRALKERAFRVGWCLVWYSSHYNPPLKGLRWTHGIPPEPPSTEYPNGRSAKVELGYKRRRNQNAPKLVTLERDYYEGWKVVVEYWHRSQIDLEFSDDTSLLHQPINCGRRHA